MTKFEQFAKNPVYSPDGAIMLDDIHCLMSDKTHLNFLADVFDFHNSIESIGDLSQELGLWMFTYCPCVWGFAVVRKLNEKG